MVGAFLAPGANPPFERSMNYYIENHIIEDSDVVLYIWKSGKLLRARGLVEKIFKYDPAYLILRDATVKHESMGLVEKFVEFVINCEDIDCIGVCQKQKFKPDEGRKLDL